MSNHKLEYKLEYAYESEQMGLHHNVLLPSVDRAIKEFKPKRIFDLGCGNGCVANYMSERSDVVVGVDPSASAVRVANQAFPTIRIEAGSAYEDLVSKYGKYDMVVTLEVVEHLFDPRTYARTIFNLLEPGGVVLMSTPYHGYIKNVVLAVSGKMDHHFTALWDGGHIKFWSIKTLTALLTEIGFEIIRIERVGRMQILAKSMVVIARRPM